MGNPFGKIIQNGVEYDVSSYNNKVVINVGANETNGAALTRLFNALRAKVSDFTTIEHAELRIKPGNNDGNEHIFRLTDRADYASDNTSRFSFLGFYWGGNTGASTAVNFESIAIGPSCSRGDFRISATGSINYSDKTSSTIGSGYQLILYY